MYLALCTGAISFRRAGLPGLVGRAPDCDNGIFGPFVRAPCADIRRELWLPHPFAIVVRR